MTSLSFWRLATNVDSAPSGPKKKKVITGEFAITLAQNDDHEERSYMRDHPDKGETTTFPFFVVSESKLYSLHKAIFGPIGVLPLASGS